MVIYQAIRVRKHEKWMIKIWILDEFGVLQKHIVDNTISNVMQVFATQCDKVEDMRQLGNEILYLNTNVSKIQIIDTSIEGSGIIAERR